MLPALVLLLHVLLLGGLAPGPGPGVRDEPPRPLLVRQIVRPAQVTLASPSTASLQATPVMPTTPATSATPAARQRTRPAAAGAAAAPTLPPSHTLPSSPQSLPAPAPATMPVAPDGQADPGGLVLPVYATRVPPPLALQFELRRGAASGQAELDWRPGAEHYRLTLQGRLGGAPPFGWTSLGGFDGAGLAPLRYTESRRGRELRAANFQRDNGRVTFSGPAIEHPLVPGGQDRLSWMVQLAAVMAANPALAETGAQVSIWVVGTRGDAEVWTFMVQGRAALELPIGRVDDALHLQREPRQPYDTQVQVWLDPSRHHLPVQALLRVRATGEGTEFRLQDLK